MLTHRFLCIQNLIICLSERVQCFRSTVILPAYCITELSQNKVLDKKERKKERRKITLRFRLQVVSNSGDSTASVKHFNSFGSAQEYLVSIHIQ